MNKKQPLKPRRFLKMQRNMSPKASLQAATALEAAPRREPKAALEAETTLKDAAANPEAADEEQAHLHKHNVCARAQ